MGGRVIPSRCEQRAGRRFVGRSPFMTLKATEAPFPDAGGGRRWVGADARYNRHGAALSAAGRVVGVSQRTLYALSDQSALWYRSRTCYDSPMGLEIVACHAATSDRCRRVARAAPIRVTYSRLT